MNSGFRKSILLFSILCFGLPLMARTEKKKPQSKAPVEQEEVSVEGPNEEADPGRSEKPEKKSEPKLTRRTMDADVGLCDGRTMKGKVQIELPDSITFLHTVDGLEFHKKVRPSDIRSIEFERWTPTEMEQRKSGRIFRFEVTRFKVELSNSTLLTVEKPLPSYLSHVTFSNKHGQVLLYSYWMDLLKSDNNWYTGIQGPATGERAFCHKDVLKKLTFTR